MVLLSRTSRLNKVVGPFLLRCGLRGRFILGGGTGLIRDNPALDAFMLLPLSQKLVSLEVQDDAVREQRRGPKEPSAFDKFAEKTFDRIFGKDKQVVPNKKKQSRTSPSENPRLAALEQYLRPVLVPNERWSDVIRWHFNNRFLKWTRAEFLIAKYGASLTEILRKNPKLRLGPLLSSKKSVLDVLKTTRDDSENVRMILPSSRMISRAFDLHDWNPEKDTDAEWQRMGDIAEQLGGQVFEVPGSSLRVADIPPETDLSELSLEEILEVTGGHVASCGPFNALCEDAGIYELWTKEYAASLASYLLDRSEEFDGGTVVLDVGAGDGLLAHFLREFVFTEAKHRLGEKQASSYATRRARKRGSKRIIEPDRSKLPKVVATDDGSRNIETKAEVEKLNVTDALDRYAGGRERQLIIICSWMPMGEDWTAAFRSAGADEYILIGECDNGNCGDNWETWGNTNCRPENEESDSTLGEMDEPQPSPSTLDGYRRTDIDFSRHQFSRFDSAVSKNSRTVSFRRIGTEI